MKITNRLVGLLMILLGLTGATRAAAINWVLNTNTQNIIQLQQVVNESPYVNNVPSVRHPFIKSDTLDVTTYLDVGVYLFVAFNGFLLYINKPDIIPVELRSLFGVHLPQKNPKRRKD